jgi:hypothetical protein
MPRYSSFETSRPGQVGASERKIQQLKDADDADVKAGGAILGQVPEVFPASRKCQDIVWGLLFVCLLGLLGYSAYTESQGWTFSGSDFYHNYKDAGLKSILVAMASSVVLACLFSLLFLVLARYCSKQLVWAALLFTPTVMLVEAWSLLAYPDFWVLDDVTRISASVSLAVSALVLVVCYCMRWQKLIDFTAKLLCEITGVLGQHLSLCFVALVSLLCSVVYAIVCCTVVVAVSSMWLKVQRDCALAASPKCLFVSCPKCRFQVGMQDFLGLYFLTAMIFAWGTTIFQNVSHTTNCGVFGRWYFRRPASVRSSLWVSLTTSFGSICLGSLILAFLLALCNLIRMIRETSNDIRGRNMVAFIMILVLECLIICIRDIVEAFNYFAYVQVAIRGFSFWSSTKVTFALCKFENLFAIVATTLVDNVCVLGALMCSILASAVGYLVGGRFIPAGLSEDLVSYINTMNITFAFLIGLATSRTILNVVRSGFATVLICWSESNEPLQIHSAQSQNQSQRSESQRLYDDFVQRSQSQRSESQQFYDESVPSAVQPAPSTGQQRQQRQDSGFLDRLEEGQKKHQRTVNDWRNDLTR